MRILTTLAGSLIMLVLLTYSPAYSQTGSASADTIRHTIYFGDREAGLQETTRHPDGTYHTLYEYNDRGRGPRFDEKIAVNEDGLITDLRITGHDYLKDSVTETFILTDGKARWQSASEQGEVRLENKEAMYTPNSGSFMPTELLIRYLLDNRKDQADLLPGGEARLLSVEKHSLGDTLDLRLVSISGFSFTPYNVWIDRQDRIFAYLYTTWFSLVREGYEDLRAEMLKIQTEKEDSYFEELAKELRQEPEGPFAITGVRLYNPQDMSVMEGMTVMVEGNRIGMVGPTASTTLPSDIKIIDGGGKTLLPGLFDMHTHINKEDGLLHLAAGVTSVRDMGNTLQLPELSRQFNKNELIGPRIVIMSGFIDKAGPYTGPIGKIITSLEEGLEAIEYYHENGYKQIKLYSSIEPEWVEPLAEKAHSLNMRLSGHIPSFMTAEEAVRDGYDEIQHANMVLLNFMPDTIDTRTPLRFTHVGAHGHEVSVESDDFAAFTGLLKREDVALDPTVSIFEGMFKGKKGEPNPAFSMIVDRLPVQTRRNYYSGGLPIPDDQRTSFSNSHKRMLDIVKKLHDEGITIVPGTDAMAGFALHRELENYVEAGISPVEVLRMATLTSAKVAGVDSDLGSIKQGKLADMILVEGNPAENIREIRKVVLTVKDGQIYDPEALYNAIGVEWFK